MGVRDDAVVLRIRTRLSELLRQTLRCSPTSCPRILNTRKALLEVKRSIG